MALAGTERMDKELTIQHMMGKFKLVVLYETGHAIQEDKPHELVNALVDFINTFHMQVKANDKKTITSISGKTVVIGGSEPTTPKKQKKITFE